MKIRHIASILLLTILNAQAAGITAQFSVAPESRIYVNQLFKLQLNITSVDVELGSNIGIDGLPDQRFLTTTAFTELEALKSQQNGQTAITRRFVCTARAPLALNQTIHCQLEVSKVVRQRTPFGVSTRIRHERVAVTPLRLSVSPLPAAGRPDLFSGAVGQFDYNVTVDPVELAQGDLVTIHGSVQGTGWLEGVQLPSLDFGDRFRSYPAREEERNEHRIAARQTVVALSTNAAAIPASSFVFFDPATGEYITRTCGPFTLTFRERETHVASTPVYNPAVTNTAISALPRVDFRIPSDISASLNVRHVISLAALPAGIIFALIVGIRLGRIKVVYGLGAATLLVVASVVMSDYLKQPAADQRPAFVMLETTQARIAPAPASASHFVLPTGSRVSILETTPRWVRVRQTHRSGWIPAATVTNTASSAGLLPRDGA